MIKFYYMKQIFISGASITYGVGGPNGGWADMIKQKIHSLQYSNTKSFKERYQVYNFAKPGAVVEDIVKSLPSDIKYRKNKNSEIVIIISVGLNNSKSIGNAKNYISSLSSYSKSIELLFKKCKTLTENIIFVGYTPVNENVANQGKSPIDNKRRYFFNSRIKKFNIKCKKLSQKHGVKFVDLFDRALLINWNKYLAADGLHLNNLGHKWVFNKTWNLLKNFIEL